MATPQENLARFQEISNRGIEDRLDPERRARFDEALNRGLISKPDFIGAGVIEPVRAIGSGINQTITGGLTGLAKSVNPFADEGAGAEAVISAREDAFTPKTKAGREGLKNVVGAFDAVSDVVNIPLSGIGGLIEILSGQGIDQAVDTLQKIKSQGVSKTLGERVFEETGSPLAATTAQLAPEAIGAALGLKGAGKAIQATERVAEAADIGKNVAEITKGVFQYQTPTKQRIAKLIREGSTDVETAKFKLSDPGFVVDKPTKIQEILRIGSPKVKADAFAVNAIKQGFDEGVIAAVKGSSKIDQSKMLKMVDLMERGKKNKLFALENRPSDVAGNSLLDRFKFVRNVNKTSGKDIDRVAKTLRGRPIDISSATSQFSNKLDELGVRLINDGKGGLKPDFELSQLSPGDRGPIKEVIRQMNIRGRGGVDAFSAHKMKRVIDNNVTFGKTKTGLSGDAERALKEFRSGLDDALDSTYPTYNKVNSTYSETIGALDSLQDVAGKKMDLTGANADKAVGVLLRRLMSNAQSRVNLLDTARDIENIANKYGGKFTDNVLSQVLFVDEIDRVFGPVARTSFQGQIDQAVKQGVRAATTKTGAADLVIEGGAKAFEKAKGINEENAFKAIKELLRGNKK